MSSVEDKTVQGDLRKRLFLLIAIVLVASGDVTMIWSAINTSAGQTILNHLPTIFKRILALPLGIVGVIVFIIAVVLGCVIYVMAPARWKRMKVVRDRLLEKKPIRPDNLDLDTHLDGQDKQLDRIVALVQRPLPADIPLPSYFVGRDRDLEVVTSKLVKGTSVAIFSRNGISGIGKSSLAAMAVKELNSSNAFPGGIYWIACNTLVGPAGLRNLWALVTYRLGLKGVLEQSEEQRSQYLKIALAGRHPLLLVLDNVEPALDLSKVLDALVVNQHSTVLICTKDTPHNDDRIVQIELGPLSQPDSERFLRVGLSNQTQNRDEKRPNADDEEVIPAFARRFRGIPVALYWAVGHAAHSGVSLRSILTTQETTDEVLIGDPSDSSLLSQTWSLLTTTQRMLFAGLSLLREESFSLDEAYALARASIQIATSQPQDTETLVVKDFGALSDYKLILSLSGARYQLHAESRRYAKQQLAAMASATREVLIDATVRFWMSSLGTAYESHEYHQMLAMAGAFVYKWDVWGKRDELQTLLERILAKEKEFLPSDALWATLQLADLNRRRGRYEEAASGYERVIARAPRLGSASLELNARRGLAEIAFEERRYRDSEDGFERTFAQAHSMGDIECEILSAHGLGTIELWKERRDHALTRFNQAKRLAHEVNYGDAQARELRWMALVHIEQEEFETARYLVQESLDIALGRHNLYNIGKCYQLFATLDENMDRSRAIAQYRLAAESLRKAQAPNAEIEEIEGRILTLERGEV